MYTPTITISELQNGDILAYRPTSLFGKLIGLYTAIKNGKFDRLAFSHVATVINGKRYDAMEGYRTGYRDEVEQAYVYGFVDITEEQKTDFIAYCLSRETSRYDRRGIVSFLFPRVAREDEFSDYCSEMIKNACVEAGIMEDVERISPYDLIKTLRPRLVFKGIII